MKYKTTRKAAVIVVTGLFALCAYHADNYELKNCKVINVSSDVVSAMDQTGNVWEFVEDGYKTGDIVNLKMNGKGTSFVEDDEIRTVEKVEA